MQVVAAAGVAGPFIADECGELAGVVILVGGIRGLLPGRDHPFGIHDLLGQLTVRLPVDDFKYCGAARLFVGAVHRFIKRVKERIGDHLGITGLHFVDRAHAVGVIGDDHPVERTVQLDGLAGVGLDLRAARQPEGILGRGHGTIETRVERPTGVDVRVAEIGALRIGRFGDGCF